MSATRMKRLLRLAHTVRHLRPVQIWGRLWFRLYRPRVDPQPAPALRDAAGRWHPCARRPSMTGARSFRFLGVEHTLESPQDWHNPSRSRLWLYNLHYFDDLVAEDAADRTTWHRDLVQSWITDNPPASVPGWEPYPSSLRIVNWIQWMLAGNAADERIRNSLAIQTRWLRRREEIHLQGNHLWANAKALVFAGAFFAGAEAERWRRHGLARVRRELAAQILPDDGHYERSPMYHAIVLEDLCDLVQLAQRYPDVFVAADVAQWRVLATRMLRWLRVMSHPDGDIALFNDAAFGIAQRHAELRAYAQSLEIACNPKPLGPLEPLPDSGYVRLTAGPAVLIADVGEIGPAHLPGHAHADTLSFELSVHGRRVLVNGGTSTYEAGPERLRQRGSAAHNTVTIEGADSSEVWASFRVARRAHPRDVDWGEHGGVLQLGAAHDGFRRLRGKPVHRRQWQLEPGRLIVTDHIEGRFTRALARLRVHPDWQLEQITPQHGTLRPVAGAGGSELHWHSSVPVRIRQGHWHPRFGSACPCPLVELPFTAPQLQFTLSWD